MSDFKPDWVSPPGDTISEIMKERGLIEKDLSKAIGIDAESLLNGTAPLTSGMAVALSNFLGSSLVFG